MAPRLVIANVLSLVVLALALLAAAPPTGTFSIPIATPTIQPAPDSLLAQAEALRLDGDYEAAAQLYRALTQRGETSLVQQAWLGLGRTLDAAGDAQGAAQALERAIALDGPGQTKGYATVRLALLRRQQSDCATALVLLHQAEPLLPLGPYLPLQQAACHDVRNEPELALAQAQRALKLAGNGPGRIDALERLAQSSVALGQPEAAFGWYEQLLGTTTSDGQRARIRYVLGQLAGELGREAEAVDRFRRLVVEQPSQVWAARALDALGELGRQDMVSLAQAGQVFFYQGQYGRAEAALSAYLAAEPQGSEVVLARYFAALARLRQGDDQRAANALVALAEDFPAASLAPDALLRAGRVLESIDLHAAAAQAFQRLAAWYPNAPQAPEARFGLGFARWLQGDQAGAEAAWSTLAADKAMPNGSRAQAQLWLGVASSEAAADHSRAWEHWQQAAGLDPDSFNGLRATERLSGLGVGSATPDLQSLEAWAETRDVRWPGLLADVQGRPAYQLATALLAAGLEVDAGSELLALGGELNRQPERLFALSALLAQPPTQHLSLAFAARATGALGLAPRELPAALQRLLYPLPYAALLRAQAERFGLDPLLLAALIRQESNFNPAARSSVGALGLTQVMPGTGRQIAQALGVADFQVDHLLRPTVSLAFGASYLAGRLAHYQGQLLPALAGYNAGDGAVGDWLAWYGDDMDRFAERIPYSETYRFVRIVYENYGHYRQLYR